MKSYRLKAPQKIVDNSLTAQIAREMRRVARLEKVVAQETRKLRAARFRKTVLMKMANHAARQPAQALPKHDLSPSAPFMAAMNGLVRKTLAAHPKVAVKKAK